MSKRDGTWIAEMGSLETIGIFPRIQPCTDCPESELAVYRPLKDALPAGWTDWHSLKIQTKGAQFSESDFVVANPARGILALEVKGGWSRKGEDKGLFAPPIGVAVVFPDVDFVAQPTQGDVEGDIHRAGGEVSQA